MLSIKAIKAVFALNRMPNVPSSEGKIMCAIETLRYFGFEEPSMHTDVFVNMLMARFYLDVDKQKAFDISETVMRQLESDPASFWKAYNRDEIAYLRTYTAIVMMNVSDHPDSAPFRASSDVAIDSECHNRKSVRGMIKSLAPLSTKVLESHMKYVDANR